MATRSQLSEFVRQRAGDRCEYCRMHQSLQGATFHVEHVVPESKGGRTEPENLAFACPSCNLKKSDRTEAIDRISGEIVRLYIPRMDDWPEHFRWIEYELEGLTPIGRATVDCLDLNSQRRLNVREAEAFFELFPPQ